MRIVSDNGLEGLVGALAGVGGGVGSLRLTHEGRLVAIARPDEGKLRPEVVLV